MTYHEWGDKDVDWKGINDAAQFLGDYCRRRALLCGQTKEKFGQVRFYASFGWLSLHTIVYPGYVYSQFPDWLWQLDCSHITPILQFFFERLFVKWQKYIYSRAYILACKKWPHLQAEILSAADYPEFIKGRTRIEIKDNKKLKHVLDLQGNIVGTWQSDVE